MKRICLLSLLMIAAALLAGCGGAADNKPVAKNVAAANANAVAKPVAAAPTKETLMTLEKSGWEAWKMRDAKWTEDNYWDKGFNLGGTGRTDKAAMIKSYATQKCDIKSYALSDDKMQMAGQDVAILTYKGAQDATCDGKKSPANVWSLAVYVREGEKWKAAFYGEAPVIDPKAPAAKPSAPAKKDESKAAEVKPDTATEALLAVETKAWEAWKAKDAKGLEDFAGKDMVSLSYTEGWTDRGATLKRWADPSCNIKSVSLTEPASVVFNSEYAMLTFKSKVDGKCGSESVPTEWGATVYGKEGGAWKALTTFSLPAS